jgi:hypothetical protein
VEEVGVGKCGGPWDFELAGSEVVGAWASAWPGTLPRLQADGEVASNLDLLPCPSNI